MSDLFITIQYDIENDKFINYNTDIKEEHINEIISTFLRTQMGAGADLSQPATLKVYTITLRLDLTYDSFEVTDDCWNKSLRDGILMHFLDSRGAK